MDFKITEIAMTANKWRRKFIIIQTAFSYSSTVLKPIGVKAARVMAHLTVFQIMITNNIKYCL